MFIKLIGLVSVEIFNILGIKHDVSNMINLIIRNLTFIINTSLLFPKMIVHIRQNLSTITFLFIIQRKRVLNYVFIPSTLEKSWNINIDIAKKGIITEQCVFSIIGIIDQAPGSIRTESSVMSIIDRVLTYELLINIIKYVTKSSVILFSINLTKMITIHIKFRKYYISNTFLLYA